MHVENTHKMTTLHVCLGWDPTTYNAEGRASTSCARGAEGSQLFNVLLRAHQQSFLHFEYT